MRRKAQSLASLVPQRLGGIDARRRSERGEKRDDEHGHEDDGGRAHLLPALDDGPSRDLSERCDADDEPETHEAHDDPAERQARRRRVVEQLLHRVAGDTEAVTSKPPPNVSTLLVACTNEPEIVAPTTSV